MVFALDHLILIPVLKEHAKVTLAQKTHSQSHHTLMLLLDQSQVSKLLVTNNQYQLLLRLNLGNHILVVFFPAAEHNLIMVSYLLVIPQVTG